MSVAASGRVVSVRPRDDGSFGVLLGPGPDVYWYISPEPPRLGAEVSVTAEHERVEALAWRGIAGHIHRLEHARATVSPRTARVIAPQWIARVEQTMTRPLYAYQTIGAAFAASRLAANDGVILADEPGLGKSTQAIAALLACGGFPAIVVAPKNLQRHWLREFGFSAVELSVELITRRRGLIRPADVYVLNFDLLRHREEQLSALGARVLVVDEAQRLKEPKPSPLHVAAVATRLALWIGRVLLLTGTPVENRAQEYWRLLYMVDPKNWPSFEEYCARYCRAPKDDEVVEARRIVTGHGRVERLDELQARVDVVTLRRLKRDVLPDLPPKSRRQILVQLDAYDMRHYKAAEAQTIAWLRAQGNFRGAGRATKALALVKLTYLRRLAALGKLRDAVPEYLRQWFDRGEIEPLVVFAHHRDILAGILQIAEAIGVRAVTIRSGAKDEHRQAAVDAFMTGQADLFVAPIRSAGVGLNLQRASDTLFAERVWVPTHLVQCEDRVHRIGQDKPVTATYLDAADTIDEYMASVVEEKSTLIDRLVDDDESMGFRSLETVVARYAAA